MKYFSLFSGEKVLSRSGKKIVPSKEAEILLEAKELIEKTQKDVLDYKESTAKECEVLKEEAEKKGFDEGIKKLHEHNLHLDHLIKNLTVDVQKKILPLALKAAKKILGEELKLHPDRIVDIVMQSLKPVVQHHKITIYVNKKDLTLIEENKSSIKEILEQVESLSIQERSDIEVGGCVIETEAGIINAQLENQWRALERAFKSFMEAS